MEAGRLYALDGYVCTRNNSICGLHLWLFNFIGRVDIAFAKPRRGKKCDCEMKVFFTNKYTFYIKHSTLEMIYLTRAFVFPVCYTTQKRQQTHPMTYFRE